MACVGEETCGLGLSRYAALWLLAWDMGADSMGGIEESSTGTALFVHLERMLIKATFNLGWSKVWMW